MTPRSIWLWFAAALTVLLLALAWVTQRTLSLETDRQAAVRDAEVQESVRLALWRMDAAASALLIREGARPPEHFRAFTAPSIAWSKSYKVLGKDQILVPSPLLTEQTENVQLHFEQAADGTVTSPQAPTGNEGKVTADNFNTSTERMAENTRKLEYLRVLLAQESREQSKQRVEPTSNERLQTGMKTDAIKESVREDKLMANNPPPQEQLEKNTIEFFKRSNALNNQVPQQAAPQMKQELAEAEGKAEKGALASAAKAAPLPAPMSATFTDAKDASSLSPITEVTVGSFQAKWIGDELLLMREVTENGSKRRQGVWIDWMKLRESLLHEVRDLFPSASLVIALAAQNNNPLQFASLPVGLVTGKVETNLLQLWTPLRRSLVIAWICVLLAAAAVAALLRGTVALSERRASFVSAVTHELRTPLTTFRLYAELLANDMLPSAEKRAEYLGTLQAEAERLSHLVENVLAYAQLERGSATARAEKLTLSELIERIRPALERRAAQVNASLVVDHGDSSDRYVEVDVSAVEQILFNLVDNACKYATPNATENIIHLEAGTAKGMALLRVRDHGRGIHREEVRRIFHPFHKSAQQAAHSAPGVGLGLALCRRLSHALGGKLRLDTTVKTEGACFVLEMPLA